MDSTTRKYVDKTLKEYDLYKELLKERKKLIIEEGGADSDINSSLKERNGASKPTEDKALKIIDDVQCIILDNKIRKIDLGYRNLDNELKEIYYYIYMKKYEHRKIYDNILHVSDRAFYKKKDKIVNHFSKYLEVVNI